MNKTNDKLTAFIYELLKNHITFGQIEMCLRAVESDSKIGYCLNNEFAANYAKHVSEKLK